MTEARATQQELIEGCQGLVRSLARKLHRGLPESVELDDLVGYGQLGLAEAARDFDPGRGGKFSTYAYYRIRGAMYDGLSKMSWFSRSRYQRLRYEQHANELLAMEPEGVGPGEPGRLEDEVQWLKRMASGLAVVYLATQSMDEECESRELVDESAVSPAAASIERETHQILHDLIDGLPVEARTLIRATYFEGVTLQEAGRRLGVSKAWASRLHAKTLDRLAQRLRQAGG
ncbi:MAG: sigma-70 family RNA polymerase sigma factor [Pirellulales bacterium]